MSSRPGNGRSAPRKHRFERGVSQRKGLRPPNAGLKLPAEELTRKEVMDLIESFVPPAKKVNIRTQAMAWLMYRLEMKAVQVINMRPRHYERGSDRLTIPGTAKFKERVVRVDPVTRRFLDAWLDAREDLQVRPAAPFFCTAMAGEMGGPVDYSVLNGALDKRRAALGIKKRVTPEGLRISGRAHRKAQHERIESRMANYMDDDWFQSRYPVAYERWKDAEALVEQDPVRHATDIGLDCREAMIAFSDDLLRYTGVSTDAGPEQTIKKVRAVIDAKSVVLGDAVSENLRALLGYWGTTWDLNQRQTHGAAREKEELTSEDARRVVFQTMLVMYEVDNALARVP